MNKAKGGGPVRMVKIAYVGKKASKDDNVTFTGTVWDGPNDVQEVEEPFAVKLLDHPNIWQLAKGEKPLVPAEGVKPETDDTVKGRKRQEQLRKELEEDEEEREAVRVDLDRMTKDAIIGHVKRTFGIDMPKGRTLDQIRQEAKDLTKRGAGVVKGARAAANRPAPRAAKHR